MKKTALVVLLAVAVAIAVEEVRIRRLDPEEEPRYPVPDPRDVTATLLRAKEITRGDRP